MNLGMVLAFHSHSLIASSIEYVDGLFKDCYHLNDET
jgi:hypothetical protein